jgi:hypothetical protein
MTMMRLLVLALLPAFISESQAGPCASEIDAMQARIDARIAALAVRGPSAPESSGALLHHQPTPGSVAQAEASVGDSAAKIMEAANAAIARARKADLAGDKKGCEDALVAASRALGQ